MLALHASNGMLAIIAEAFIVASMLLICVTGRYYGVHKDFVFNGDPFQFEMVGHKIPIVLSYPLEVSLN